MYVIGVTGGIASGKSIVAQRLGRRGAKVLNADRIGHAVLRLEEVKQALHARWGDQVFKPVAAHIDAEAGVLGRVDRGAVARLVFAPPPSGPEELAFLERLTHPRIDTCMTQQLAHWRDGGQVLAAVLDAPVLYKAGWDRHCDRIIYVDASWEIRVARAAERGWSADELESRQSQQPSLEFQRQRADVVIDNSGELTATIEQIDTFWDTLVAQRQK